MTMLTALTDPLHNESGPTTRWTTVNTAEALPGVPTPLCWTLWSHQLERAMRGAFFDIGCLPRSAVHLPDRVDDRYSGIFFGRFSANIDRMRDIGDVMPGDQQRAEARHREFGRAHEGEAKLGHDVGWCVSRA